MAGDPNNQKVLAEMQQKMLQLFMDTHPQASELREGLSLEEKLISFCEPPDLNTDLEAR